MFFFCLLLAPTKQPAKLHDRISNGGNERNTYDYTEQAVHLNEVLKNIIKHQIIAQAILDIALSTNISFDTLTTVPSLLNNTNDHKVATISDVKANR